MSRNAFVIPACAALFIVLAAHITSAQEKAANGPAIQPGQTFQESLRPFLSRSTTPAKADLEALRKAHPIQVDWLCQDTKSDLENLLTSPNPANILHAITSSCLTELKPEAANLKNAFAKLDKTKTNLDALLDLYLQACERRRAQRLKNLRATSPKIVFLKNIEIGNAPRAPMSISDGPFGGKPFSPGASICLLDLSDDLYAKPVTLLEDRTGMLRDLDVSHDAQRLLFVWKKSARGDDYHLYEMTVSDRGIRQITGDPGVADVQGRYLPDGILYHSTRCATIVDCNETIDTVNLFTCDLDGKNIRRLSYDQVSTQYPAVLPDGRIIYTRWEYNDRGQIYPQALFAMNPDGSNQVAIYGNNSWYPTSLIQARAVPNSNKIITIIAGHHTPPTGKLALIDLNAGQDEGQGLTLVAPVRPNKYEHVDSACQDDVLFQHPHALNEDEYLVGFSAFGRKKDRQFGIYYMHRDGRRELLAWDPDLPCRQPLPLAPRPQPRVAPSNLDPSQDTGVFYVDNIYLGGGLKGVKKGTVKSLRVIALEFRAAHVGINFNDGPAGSARVATPMSVGGAWDVKRVLGDAQVYPDGSACFTVPARTPVYFQAIDDNGYAVQSMRSWSTLQPGETLSCIGCHETRNNAPAANRPRTVALRKGPQELTPFHGPPRGFSYLKEVQPILDRHCVRCHDDRPYEPPLISGNKRSASPIFCSWPAQYSRSDIKRAVLHLSGKQTVSAISIYWLTQGDKALRAPENWKLSYRAGADWKPLPNSSEYAPSGHPGDAEAIYSKQGAKPILERCTLSPPIETDVLLIEATLPPRAAGGIESWTALGADGRPLTPQKEPTPLNLSGGLVYEDLSGRAWAQSYLNLLRAGFKKHNRAMYVLNAYPNDYIDWISPQSGPAMLEPYSFGAAKSGLLATLRAGHENVKLSAEEYAKLACWIDLAVPYCGAYPESSLWTPQDHKKYTVQQTKRTQLVQAERLD